MACEQGGTEILRCAQDDIWRQVGNGMHAMKKSLSHVILSAAKDLRCGGAMRLGHEDPSLRSG